MSLNINAQLTFKCMKPLVFIGTVFLHTLQIIIYLLMAPQPAARRQFPPLYECYTLNSRKESFNTYRLRGLMSEFKERTPYETNFSMYGLILSVTKNL